MVYFTKVNCVHCDNYGDCKHPRHERKCWIARLLFGIRSRCVLETARFSQPRDGEVTCDDQKKFPKPNMPPPKP